MTRTCRPPRGQAFVDSQKASCQRLPRRRVPKSHSGHVTAANSSVVCQGVEPSGMEERALATVTWDGFALQAIGQKVADLSISDIAWAG